MLAPYKYHTIQAMRKMYDQRGISLIVVLLILVIVSLLGVASIQISRMATQSARNERDTQIAWQAAESALLDAELDILGMPSESAQKRGYNTTDPTDPNNKINLFDRKNTDISQFIEGCGNNKKNKGLCKITEGATPNWLSVDFLATSNQRYVSFGEYTARTFQAGEAGIQPAHPPRYIVELLDDPNIEHTKDVQHRKYIFRITAIGFGPNEKTQVVLQSIYRN
jgi:type IV pilus assembly protein PilX